MKLSEKKQRELKVWEYFIPTNCQWGKKTDKDIEMFFEWSEQGKHKDILSIPTYESEGRTYFHALYWGKKKAGINIHELWEPSFNAHDGSWTGYENLFKEMPQDVVNYTKKEIFKGEDFRTKVYDLTQIFNELDLLEIRLNILDPQVDWFVIGESTQTFSGQSKTLYYQENKEKFSKWNHKIIHVVIPTIETENVFERTAFQKDYLRTALKDCRPDDVIYYGDVDEIWTPQTEEGKLRQFNYCYYLDQRSSEDWQGTNVCKFKNLRNLNELRADHDRVLENGGWHFTNMGGLDQIRKKIAAYDHQEMINDDVRTRLEERFEQGEDYLGRRWDWQGRPFEMWLDSQSLPQYLKDNRDQWTHLFK